MTDPLLRSHLAPDPRTLVDVFRATVEQAGDEPAVDAGNGVLTYAELEEAAEALATELAGAGVGPGDKVGVRVTSGTTDLYVAILGVLLAGAAYVPVDAEDPEERARLVFGEADVAVVVGDDLVLDVRRVAAPREREDPGTGDDAWVIFTSGSTGTPKGVAVTHRNAAAFVDAESRMFLQDAPLGVGDRVMAGLSVAFDASCEEIWLAWRYGACLVPAPRALVRSGIDVGPWLVANRITVVSTVPTLVALWPAEALERVRLLIMGGEALPAELAARLVREGREVWNTYGPTEATVVACGAAMTGDGPVRIGLPLDGWDLAVVDPAMGVPVAEGEQGELIIGGVGLARYLDPAKDAEKYAPMPTLGWERAYRSGDVVVNDPAGLLFAGRADDQVKLGGRRIELGEVDSALLALPGVQGAAAAVRSTAAGNQLLVGYVATDPDFDPVAALERLRTALPAALVPRLAVVETLPTRTSGKVDRDALPWPLPGADAGDRAGGTGGAGGGPADLSDTEGWIAALWLEVLGAEVSGAGDDFFDLGGGSLTAAQMVSRLRVRFPEVAVGDLYEHPRLGALAAYLDSLAAPQVSASDRSVRPIPTKSQGGQVLGTLGVRAVGGLRWLAWTVVAAVVLHDVVGLAWAPDLPWWLALVLWVAFLTPPGRMLLAAGQARLLLRGIGPGTYPRGGRVHLKLWLADRLADEIGATALAGAPLATWYARLLGARVGRDVDLHALPPVTGLLRLGRGASVEPEVDLSGYWIDGDAVHLGRIEVGARARVGARSTLCPGAVVGSDAEIGPGSAVFGVVPDGEFWAGSPARRRRKAARGPWQERPVRSRAWVAAYALAAAVVGLLPALAVAVGLLVALPGLDAVDGAGDLLGHLLVRLPLAVLVALLVLAASVWLVVRLCALGVRTGVHPVRSGAGLAVWTTLRVLDEARTWLFWLYSSSLTPWWLRALGARIGRGVEASTVLMIPSLTQVNDHAFLADDTLIGGYELGGGWLRAERVKIGKRAFVGNSGMAAPGRKVPKASLVAVLSAAPQRKAARSGDSWLGSPPAPLRRTSEAGESTRTYAPPRRLHVYRALVELCRLVPVLLHAVLATVVVVALVALLGVGSPAYGLLLAALAVGPLLALAGLLAAAVTTAAKWLLVGRMEPGAHPLWSSFVWRNELADTFVEVLAVPWFARTVTGTPLLNVWFRSMGAHIGRGVWCDTHWLPEADLVHLDDGATVNAGTVVQTHLFHDRVLALDTVRLRRGATLGPNSVVLPAAEVGRHATVGPVSLVMRGESLPDKTTWIGNPIGPWADAPATEVTA
ncbi:amino acid adenylation domain-containing protein [Nocardioides zeae]|uniref:Amino acid adenylation domain-containing protein n=1 Tax=Nocardioides imazamoxiresistens TaxID=3231893 RepID=A0ABU3PRL2_9ACTN|nr:Pls/PosA family non-ribosomal peptide synthetase [Nocardioides zeae]MDT9591858.1 amino acid adenylation domain-containing protein [Nocardioides zeae]